MAFGMTNAPSTFQRLIDSTINDLEGTYAYLDDIVVVGNRLSAILERLSQANLTVNLKKSNFGQGTVTYLGHIVGGGNVRPKNANVEAILEYPVPTTKKSLKRFLGMTPY